MACPVAAAGPGRRYRIIAGFAEHDERFGSRAEVEVQLAAAPAREEAVQLVWRDGAAAAKMAGLFDPEPETWGLRGDPYVWRALREHLSATDIPASAGEAASLLHAAFRELVGHDLVSDTMSSVYLERYAHGGMSSGMISLDTWRQRLMPLLAERARTLLAT